MGISKTVVIDQYFDFYKKSIIEYGDKTCVLMRLGGFWECYSIINEKENIGNAKEISEVIHCEFSNKNKVEKAKTGFSNRSFPDFFGFNVNSKSKYVPMLISAGYTVVIVDQIGDQIKGQLAKREITTVCSSTLKLPEYEIDGDTETNLVGVVMEFVDNCCLYSVCNINNVTNKIEVTENAIEGDLNLDEISRILLRIGCIKELQLNVINMSQSKEVKLKIFFKEYTNNFRLTNLNECIKYKDYIKPNFQNDYLRNVYKNVQFGLLSPLEYLELSKRQLCTINLMYIFDFIGKHDIRYLSNLSIPKIIDDSDHLILALNTLVQLNIQDIFKTINFTNTTIGRRYLKNLLCKPFKDSKIITSRLNLTNELKELIQKLDPLQSKPCFGLDLDKELKCIIDFERLHRKMSLEALRPFEFEKLNQNYIKIKDIIELIPNFSIIPDTLLKEMNEYINDFTQMFNLQLLKSYNGTTIINFFNKGIIPELDIIEDKLIKIEKSVEDMRVIFDSSINDSAIQQVKLDSTETDGLFFTCTKIRYEKMKEKLNEHPDKKNTFNFKTFKVKVSGSSVKFSNEQLSKLSFNLLNNRELLNKQTNLHFQNKLKEYSQTYNKLFIELKEFIEVLDITNSNLKCSLKYNYTCPTLIESTDSFIECKDIRHPIIERITETEYITNDITLNSESCGILVYGINSCGKSSLLRALGVNLILAQCGLYTASSSFKFSPFDTLISQVDLTDNLFNGKSSFVSEMSGLKKILSCADKNVLILSDELCKGTENSSAEAIVSSCILHLLESKSKFFFTSHLHRIPTIERIKQQKKLQIAHLSVTIKGEEIIFDRKLKNGSGPDIYGLEVAKHIINLPSFIDTAFEIRNELEINTIKKSNYNTKKITSCCEICKYKPLKGQIQLDTHHIKEQKDANESGFFTDTYFHKNSKFNLVTLCKPCHKKIDTGELIINGYKQSNCGIFLDYIQK